MAPRERSQYYIENLAYVAAQEDSWKWNKDFWGMLNPVDTQDMTYMDLFYCLEHIFFENEQ